MKRIVLLATFGILAIVQLSAQSKLPAHMHHQILQNGLEVLIIENNSVPLITIELAVKNGAFTETSETNGLSHLYEHLFFTPNKVLSTEKEFTDHLAQLGVVHNATTSDERVNYFINMSSHVFDEGLELMRNAIREPMFSTYAIEREHEIIRAKFQQAEINPVHFLVNDVNQELWGNGYPRKNALGKMKVIVNAKVADLETMHKRYYVPNNTLLSISGDIDKDAAIAAVKKHFGDWSRTVNPHEVYPVPAFDTLHSAKSVITLNENAQGPLVLVGFRGPTTADDRADTYATDVLSYMLSQKGSGLQDSLSASGLAYQIGVGYQTQKYGAPLTIFLVPKAQAVKEAVAKLEENIQQWDDPGFFSEEELEHARRMLSVQELYSREVPSGIVHNISYWWASADIDYFADYVDNIKKVTHEDVARVVRTYIHGQPNVTGLLVTLQMKEMLGLDDFTPLKTE